MNTTKQYLSLLQPPPGEQNTQSDRVTSHQVALLDQARKIHTEAVQGPQQPRPSRLSTVTGCAGPLDSGFGRVPAREKQDQDASAPQGALTLCSLQHPYSDPGVQAAAQSSA